MVHSVHCMKRDTRGMEEGKDGGVGRGERERERQKRKKRQPWVSITY